MFLSQLPDAGGLSFRVRGPDLMEFHLDVEALKILPDDVYSFFDVIRGADAGNDDSHLHFARLVIKGLGQGVCLIAVLPQELLYFSSFLVTDAGTVVDHFVHCGFCRAGKLGNLLQCNSHGSSSLIEDKTFYRCGFSRPGMP